MLSHHNLGADMHSSLTRRNGGQILAAAPSPMHSLIDEITQDAMRRAALAPTYMAALDITGAALLEVAAVVRMGEMRIVQ
jgi:hypothetical protein